MFHATTILAVRKNKKLVFAGDGQASMGQTIVKSTVKKLRKLDDGKIIGGFAGSTADAFTLFDLFESKIKEYSGKFERAAVEMAKMWRTDKILRNLEAMLLLGNKEKTLLISGNGDILEPDKDAHAIGSGGSYALAAACALLNNTDLSAREIAKQSMDIAADICVYTNHNIVFEEIESDK
jgi:ATP-dependent HslUV protease, peptidase subunit HslV